MTIEITWSRGIKQRKRLVSTIADHIPYKTFTMNSPIYRAIEDGSFMLFGKYKFTAKEVS